jgi:hypothetical protein
MRFVHVAGPEESFGSNPMKAEKSTVRIGGASGFWGDASLATSQLLAQGDLDFIVYDYLAEITMGILARVRAKDPQQGYAGDFVTAAMAPNLVEISRQGVKIVSNAGGVNPLACAAALRAEIAKQGLSLKVAAVVGDDLMDQLNALAQTAPRDMFSGAPFPEASLVGSVNAYLGAFPIAAALRGGADIVLTGRCVDSAVTLGACIHQFGWTTEALDPLAGGSLAGHILECGTQATGGNFTDWALVANSYARMGYPIAEVACDGSFLVSKPKGSGGMVSVGTVAEQMLYEIGDPQAYLLPDVSCDFSEVVIEQLDVDLVRVTGAKGRAAPAPYKACVTWRNGYRGGHLFGFYGIDAERKAMVFAQSTFERSRAILARAKAPDFSETSVELIGAESQFGAQRSSGAAREVAAKIAVRHPSAMGVGLFLKEATGLGLSAPPGLCGFAGARPKPSPVMALFSMRWPKDQVRIRIVTEAGEQAFQEAAPAQANTALLLHALPAAVPNGAELVSVPLVQLAWARSGDKGDSANIGVIAREPAFLPWIAAALDTDTVARLLAHFLQGKVERFYLPGTHALNFLLHAALGGGGTSSLRFDPQAKGYSQLLLSHPVRIPASLSPAQS